MKDVKMVTDMDRHVGTRIRLRRMMVRMSQQKLGEALGLTFQQVQKYEKGMNRVGAGRLQRIAEILGVGPEYFFDGAAADPSGAIRISRVADDLNSFISSPEGNRIVAAFATLSPQVKRRMADLIEAIATETAATETIAMETVDLETVHGLARAIDAPGRVSPTTPGAR